MDADKSGLPVFELHVPQYTVEIEPDYKAIGNVVDDEIKRHFMDCTIVARGVGGERAPG